MANWCHQILVVEAPRNLEEGKQQLMDFQEVARYEDPKRGLLVLSEQNFLPTPAELKEVYAGSEEDIYHAWYGDWKRLLKHKIR